jgi:hypothetical protein
MLRIERRELPAPPAESPRERTTLRLTTGARWQLEVPTPPRASTLVIPGSCVASNGFPSAALGVYLARVAEVLTAIPGTKLGVFGHVDADGGHVQDKLRSDALARVVHALSTNDEAAFEALAADSTWSVAEHQAILRALGSNPAAIDGDAGALTHEAAGAFQEEWNLGWHHPDGADAPLERTGTLDAATCLALRRSYLLMLSAQFSAEQFVAPGWAGCGAFVPREQTGAGPQSSSRVVLALFGERRPASFPCVAADPSACRVDGIDPRRCRFYRQVVEERRDSDASDVFYDFEWMLLPSGKVNLSVLTSLADGARPTFEVYRHVVDYDGLVRRGTGAAGARGTLVVTLEGIVRFGVAVAMFEPPDDWSPFDLADWCTDLDAATDGSGDPASDPDGPGGLAATFRPPVFRVRATPDGDWADSTAPGRRLDRIPVDDVREGGVAVASDGRTFEFWFEQTRAWPGERRRADEHLRVIAWQALTSGFATAGVDP